MRWRRLLFFVAALCSLFVSTPAGATGYRIIAYITWGNLSDIWSGGSTLHTEPSLDYVTDIVGPAVVPHSTSDPYLEGMYGDLSAFAYIADAASDHGLTATPYIYMSMDDLETIISGGHLATLVSSTDSLIGDYGLGGITLDVEGGTNPTAMDALVDAMYTALNPSGKTISIAAQYGQFGGLVPDVSVGEESKLDYISPMCYDLWGYGDQSSGYPHSTTADSQTIMQAWVNAGFSRSKLLMGIPFYGKDNTASATMDYKSIVAALHPSASTDSGSVSGVTYWWGGIDTDQAKAGWLKTNTYAGAMLFAMGYDDLNTSYSLTKAIYDTLNGSAPAPPTGVFATDGTSTSNVTVTWTGSEGATGYRVYRNGVNIGGLLGDVATYTDTTAVAGIITPGAAAASDGTSTTYVAVAISGQSVASGGSYTYTVRAVNDDGTSGDSAGNPGYRGVGSLTYQWQRSTGDSDTSYSNITGATTVTYNDAGAPSNGDGRYWRCPLSATGATSQTSSANRGYRQTASPPTTTTTPPAPTGGTDGVGAIFGIAAVFIVGGAAISKLAGAFRR